MEPHFVDNDVLAETCRQRDPDTFTTLCRMHLLFKIHLNFCEFDSDLEKLPLTTESAKGIHELIEYLSHDFNLVQEGIFRKSGKISRQQELLHLIREGKPLDLNSDSPYNVHDCASVLKTCLAGLTEPLLTNDHYAVHRQIADLCKEHQMEALQLLFLLLPSNNRILMKSILTLLHQVSQESSRNRMSATNLAIMFAPHILCPRNMISEDMLKTSGDLAEAVAFMIQNAPELFDLPKALLEDLRLFVFTDKGEPIRTCLSFCEQCRPKDIEYDGAMSDITAVALAELYAHVQSMPKSKKKCRLIKKFNKENKKSMWTSMVQSFKGSRSLRKSLTSLKRLFGKNKRHS